MKKYEDDLMEALKRWFWYNGLLEAIYDDEGNIKEWEIKPIKLWNREKKQINGYQIKALINLNEEQYELVKKVIK